MRYFHATTVKWSGTFPVDMLRYDCCYPADGASVDAIHASFDPFDIKDRNHTFTAVIVKMSNHKDDGFTQARWLSFGAVLSNTRTDKR